MPDHVKLGDWEVRNKIDGPEYRYAIPVEDENGYYTSKCKWTDWEKATTYRGGGRYVPGGYRDASTVAEATDRAKTLAAKAAKLVHGPYKGNTYTDAPPPPDPAVTALKDREDHLRDKYRRGKAFMLLSTEKGFFKSKEIRDTVVVVSTCIRDGFVESVVVYNPRTGLNTTVVQPGRYLKEIEL